MDKRAFYQQPEVVDQYEAWRFGTKGGQYVDEREKSVVLALLKGTPTTSKVLDLPCGTGRLLRALGEAGYVHLSGADTSPAMLNKSQVAWPQATIHLVDAFATGFPDASFDVVCSIRFLFHVEEPQRLMAEVARILRPGGKFVFDSIRWTPRGLCAPIDRALGGRLYCYGEAELVRLLKSHGLEATSIERALALPSLLYRFLPSFLVPVIRWLESRIPDIAFTKTFLLATKTEGYRKDTQSRRIAS